jgi:hypothetical protein
LSNIRRTLPRSATTSPPSQNGPFQATVPLSIPGAPFRLPPISLRPVEAYYGQVCSLPCTPLVDGVLTLCSRSPFEPNSPSSTQFTQCSTNASAVSSSLNSQRPSNLSSPLPLDIVLHLNMPVTTRWSRTTGMGLRAGTRKVNARAATSIIRASRALFLLVHYGYDRLPTSPSISNSTAKL